MNIYTILSKEIIHIKNEEINKLNNEIENLKGEICELKKLISKQINIKTNDAKIENNNTPVIQKNNENIQNNYIYAYKPKKNNIDNNTNKSNEPLNKFNEIFKTDIKDNNIKELVFKDLHCYYSKRDFNVKIQFLNLFEFKQLEKLVISYSFSIADISILSKVNFPKLNYLDLS